MATAFVKILALALFAQPPQMVLAQTPNRVSWYSDAAYPYLSGSLVGRGSYTYINASGVKTTVSSKFLYVSYSAYAIDTQILAIELTPQTGQQSVIFQNTSGSTGFDITSLAKANDEGAYALAMDDKSGNLYIGTFPHAIIMDLNTSELGTVTASSSGAAPAVSVNTSALSILTSVACQLATASPTAYPGTTFIWQLTVGPDGNVYGVTSGSTNTSGSATGGVLFQFIPSSTTGNATTCTPSPQVGAVTPLAPVGGFFVTSATAGDPYIYASTGYSSANGGFGFLVYGPVISVTSPPPTPVAKTYYSNTYPNAPYVFRGSDGNAWANVLQSNGSYTGYSLSGGQPVPSTKTQPANAATAYTVDSTTVTTVTTINQRKPGSGSAPPTAQTLTTTFTPANPSYPNGLTVPLPLERLFIYRLGLGPNGHIYGSTILPLHIFEMPSSIEASNFVADIGNGEIYSVLGDAKSQSLLLLGAYGATIAPSSNQLPLLAYDTYSGGALIQPPQMAGAPLTNTPALPAGELGAWRPMAMVQGPDYKVYAGYEGAINQTQGGYAIWDSPFTNATPTAYNIPQLDKSMWVNPPPPPTTPIPTIPTKNLPPVNPMNNSSVVSLAVACTTSACTSSSPYLLIGGTSTRASATNGPTTPSTTAATVFFLANPANPTATQITSIVLPDITWAFTDITDLVVDASHTYVYGFAHTPNKNNPTFFCINIASQTLTSFANFFPQPDASNKPNPANSPLIPNSMALDKNGNLWGLTQAGIFKISPMKAATGSTPAQSPQLLQTVFHPTTDSSHASITGGFVMNGQSVIYYSSFDQIWAYNIPN